MLIQYNENEIFKALSEPVRTRILTLLTIRDLCVCDLTATLNLPQSTVSRHMKVLRTTGLVEAKRVGQWIHYSLKRDNSFKESLLRIISDFKNIEPYKSDIENLTKTSSC